MLVKEFVDGIEECPESRVTYFGWYVKYDCLRAIFRSVLVKYNVPSITFNVDIFWGCKNDEASLSAVASKL
jgi:hypothetical protein